LVSYQSLPKQHRHPEIEIHKRKKWKKSGKSKSKWERKGYLLERQLIHQGTQLAE
jgi:hypothetical protein